MSSASTAQTPMMRQYYELKEAHPGTILLFRCGDFYETYGTDAEEAGRLLNIIVTRKAAGADGPVPMAGVPFHAIDTYIARLVRAGKRVAIAEQTEDPRQAKGLVRRDVVRVITPGTAVEEGIVEETANNYLVALSKNARGTWGIALADISTGYFALTEVAGESAEAQLLTEIARMEPKEILLPHGFDADVLQPVFAERPIPITRRDAANFRRDAAHRVLCEHYQVQSLDGFGAEDFDSGISAAGALLRYLQDTQMSTMRHITNLRVRFQRDTMVLDAVTQRSLELVRNIHGGGREATLLSVLDRTLTPMGARMLRNWILEPLRDRQKIEGRYAAISELIGSTALRGSLTEGLKGVRDIERIASRAAVGTAGPKDLATLREGLQRLPRLVELLETSQPPLLRQIAGRIDPMEDLADLLMRALVESPPATVRDGGVIARGFSPELDELAAVSRGGKDFIAQLRAGEAERTGVQNLKIGYNKVFGYYIELTKAQLKQLGDDLPEGYIRKQTLANAERFITPELKEKEEQILHAEEKIQALEVQLFTGLRETVADNAPRIIAVAQAIARVDCLLSLAEVALSRDYVRPDLNEDGRLEIQEGRHPVLEALQKDPPFVPNDTLLDPRECQIALITGPNMAGKSTFIRQVALIVLLAHMGSFVPAQSASIPLRDRIFTRVGAMDHLARGQSTFLVEMSELANILHNATSDSLVILDEIGRGTSTYDGLSIAWAAGEYIHNTRARRPLTLFATHYHELTDLEGALPRLKNFSVAVHEEENRIVFLYRIVRGGTDRSYGIHAAELAGCPPIVVTRSREILDGLERGEAVAARVATETEEDREALQQTGAKTRPRKQARLLPTVEPWEDVQLTLFDASAPNPAVEKLKTLDVNQLTPLEALTVLAELKRDSEG